MPSRLRPTILASALLCPMLAATAVPARAGFLDMLFGPPPAHRSGSPFVEPGGRPEEPARPRATPRGGARQVCVRLCDGFYYPLESVATRGGSSQDDCETSCPGMAMGVYRVSGDDMADARDVTGRRYGDLEHAFSYRTSVTAACGCRRSAGAASVMGDMTLRNGDIVVTADGAVVFRGLDRETHAAADFENLRTARGLPKGVFAQADKVLGFSFQDGLARQSAAQVAARPESHDIVVRPMRRAAATSDGAEAQTETTATVLASPRVVLPMPHAGSLAE